MKLSIVVVAYNRKDSLKRLLDNLTKSYYPNSEIHLIISIDKSNTDEVEKYAEEYEWIHGVKIVDKHSTNLGLRNHMMSLGKWFDEYDALIILEDDIIPSRNFYYYALSATEQYFENSRIAGISLYNFSIHYSTYQNFIPQKNEYDVYLMRWAMSWGQVWMKHQWLDFYNWYITHTEFLYDSHLPSTLFTWSKNSWLKYHIRYLIENDKYFVYPYVSLTTNGAEPGVHNKFVDTTFQVPLLQGLKKKYFMPKNIDLLVCYDEFFENLNIKQLFKDDKNLCVDLTGSHDNILDKKYLLSYQHLDFKIIKSYGAILRPIEANVFEDIKGNDFFLYDTSEKCHNNIDDLNLKRYLFFTFNLYWNFKKVGIKNFLCDFLNIVKLKFLK